MARELKELFYPKSVCVVGASQAAEKVGGILLRNIIRSKYSGEIFPVNPHAESIENLKCYPDINSLPSAPELAIVAIPAVGVNEILKQVGEKGIKNVVVVTAGFKEIGEEGLALERELIKISEQYGMNLLGPNCMGFINNLFPINATFGQSVNQVGNLRFMSQSGAIAASLFDWCSSTGLGLSEFVTLGNKAVLNENDILRYFQSQIANEGEGIHPIGLYLESISDGTEFLRLTSEIAKTNPLFIIKPGKTKAAAKAMQSHTGSIAGEDSVLDAAVAQAGVIRCQTLEEFFDAARAFSWESPPMGPRVAILSNAGGPAVITADAVEEEGLQVAGFDGPIKDQLMKVLPRFASVVNPVDILGDALADRYAAAAEIILQTDEADSLMIILTPQVMTQIEKTAELIGGLQKYKKPIFCAFMGGGLIAEGEKKLNELKIPVFRFPERAIAAIGMMRRWREHQETQKTAGEESGVFEINSGKIGEIIGNARQNNQKTLDNFQSNEILGNAGISTPATAEVRDLKNAQEFAETHSWPVVLKFSAPGMLHKKDVGGVVTDISNNWQLEIVWDNFQRKISTLDQDLQKHVKVQIQKHILNGVEVIVGAKRDPNFGPVILFGAGGTYAELIGDRNLHLLPMNIAAARELVGRSKISKILKGYRGDPPYALDKLYEVIGRLAKIIESQPEITEIEINPLIVTLNNVWAVDGKVVLKEGEVKTLPGPAFAVATVVSREILASKFNYLVLQPEKPVEHKPGQYISVKVSNQRINLYSIAADDPDGRIAILVDTKPGGVGSKFFENVKMGDKVAYLGPFGIFTLQADEGKQIIMMGTGSGIAPLRRMIDELLKNKQSQSPIHLYFGLRFTSDIFWHEYFLKLAQEHANFKYDLVLSKPDESWTGLTGHITDRVKADFPDASNVTAYLCGSKDMIEEGKEILIAQGCAKERIFVEKY
jgi:acetyltransferase